MSVVIIGGNDRMHRLYKDTCAEYGCRAKVFTQPQSTMAQKIGNADLMIVFTNTVSHKMTKRALGQAKRCNAKVERCHSSSLTALHAILSEHCLRCKSRSCCKNRLSS